MSEAVDWKLVDERLAVADTPEAKQHRDELFRALDPNGNGSLSLSEVQSGLGKFLEKSSNLRKGGEAAKGLIPGITDYKLPIKAAFKNARTLGHSPGGDSSTVDRTEFHPLLVYFRHYLELLALFKKLDAGGDMTLSTKEILPSIGKLEKWNITAAQVKSKLKMEPNEEISFDHFADWCVQGKLKGFTFDATEGVKELKASSSPKASSDVARPMSPETPSKPSVHARSSREQEANRMRLVQEKTEKMRAVEKEYRQKLNQIALQESTLKLPDNKLPSFHARVQSNTQNRKKEVAASDAEYKTRLQQHTVLQDERITKVALERAASVAGMKAKVDAQRQEQRAMEVKHMGSFYYGLPDGKPPRPAGSKSAPLLYIPLTPEEMAERMERLRNPIWDKPLKERAQASKNYMTWAASLKATAKCAVDHKFTGQRGGVTDRQLELIEAAAAEKRYWKWTTQVKFQKCTIDQAWVVEKASMASTY